MHIYRSILDKELLNDLLLTFEKCNYLDSSKLTSEELKNSTKMICWNKLLENTRGMSKESYIVYDILNQQDNYFGDGDVVLSKLYCDINIYTTLPHQSRGNYNLRSNFEKNFSDDNWSVIYNIHDYDNKSKLNHYSYTVGKFYGYKQEDF